MRTRLWTFLPVALAALGEGTPGSELTAVDTGSESDDDLRGMSGWLAGGLAALIGFLLMAIRFFRQ